MKNNNVVFIGASLDGFIADKDGGLDWLQSIPNPENSAMGYHAFMEGVDALIMGRKTFEMVCSFEGDWPYTKQVFVLSSTLNKIPEALEGKVSLLQGSLAVVLEIIHKKGYHTLYIDGGSTIQQFLREDLIDELIITTIPVLLGGGVPLFSDLPKELMFEHVKSSLFLGEIVQNHYRRKK